MPIDLASIDPPRLAGELITPGDPDYDQLRGLWNGDFDRRPSLIARCADPGDVAAAVQFARHAELPIAVRGGGHGVAGYASVDDGLMIDLSLMTGVSVNAEQRIVRAGGGCRIGDVDRLTQRHGLAAPLGVVSRTGIAGLTLSGGMGWLRRLHGLSCDNLIAAEVVTADGRVLTASESEHRDLLWGLRGGGGNFGVVTALEYRLHPVGPEVFFCFTLYPIEQAAEVLCACEHLLATGREELSPVAVLGHVPAAEDFAPELHGKPFIAVLAVHPDGEDIPELRSVARPLADLSGVMPYVKVQSALDGDYPDGARYYWKSLNLDRLDDAAIETIVEHLRSAPSTASTVDVWFQGGAIARTDRALGAFAARSSPYMIGIEANWQTAAESDVNTAWARTAWRELRPFSAGATYLNFPGLLEEGSQLIHDAFGANYQRLVVLC
jgi:hypothetical protein